ncbi:GldG family protein [Corallococcus sp. M34]|uniref:GldG family protein n=1 Tax=Citreicoccus inhibens TaxID=2849499 RepID=UPI001C2174EB|nr:Gldg family protein [Citreicoccus inhibens]MBU8897644.1 GldG family protein [Citreicoccus inhibens]
MRLASIGRFLGAFGLLLVLTSPLPLLLGAGSGLAAACKGGVGLLFLGIAYALQRSLFTQLVTVRWGAFAVRSVLGVTAVLVGLVALNVLVFRHGPRWDLTQDRLFTLAPQTHTTLAALPDKVTAIGLLPPNDPSYDALEALFRRYHEEAPERFDFTFKDPGRNPEFATRFQLKAGQTTVMLVRGEGAKESRLALHGVSEQELTNALIQLSAVGTRKAYFLTGHAEWPLERQPSARGDGPGDGLAELGHQLAAEGYTAESLNLAGQKQVPRDAALVIIAGAKTRYTAPEIDALQAYLAEGGRMLYFAEAAVSDGLDSLLSDYGVALDEGIVADTQFNAGNPYVLVSKFYSEHAIGKPLLTRALNIELVTARSFSLLRTGTLPGVHVEPVVLSSPYAWVETHPAEDATPTDGEKTGQLTLVAASTRPTRDASAKRSDEARLVVVGDSELILDPNWGHEPNRNLVMNSLAWASTQIEKITLRPPDRAVSTLKLSPDVIDAVRLVAMDLLPLSLLGLGLAVWLARREQA